MAEDPLKKTAAHLEQCLARHLPCPLRPAAHEHTLTPGQDFREGLSEPTGASNRRYERIKAERENLVAVSKLYVHNKSVLKAIGQNWRRRRAQQQIFGRLKELTDKAGVLQLKTRIFGAEVRARTRAVAFRALKENWRTQRERVQLAARKKELEEQAAAEAGRLQQAVGQLEAILESRLWELAAKTGRLGAIQKRYGEMSG